MFLDDDFVSQEAEERDYMPATIAEHDQDAAFVEGSEHPDREWILSDRDVWYANPYYTGPKSHHPECCCGEPGC